jgi:hypothetical protein
MKKLFGILFILYHGNNLNKNYCSEDNCQKVKTSWLGCGWPNMWHNPCRDLDANGREGRFYKYGGQVHTESQNYQNHNHYLDDTYKSAAFYKWYRKGKENKKPKTLRKQMLQKDKVFEK